MTTPLTPAQQAVLADLNKAWYLGSLLVLTGGPGSGKTTLLRELHRQHGGISLSMRDLLEGMRAQHPLALEETFEHMLLAALQTQDRVFLDDLHLLTVVCLGCSFYPRPGLLQTALTTLATVAGETSKKLVFTSDGSLPAPIQQRAYTFTIPDFKPVDYDVLCQAYLGTERTARLDMDKVHRFASRLTAHQLRAACLWLRDEAEVDTDRFIDYLRSQWLVSNVNLGEVQAVDLHDLQGVDAVLRSLEANIILPLENDALATELNLKPKRGVLLAGPPGTGKTTVGRALAHRLKSKFFLLDGTVVSGAHDFYNRVHQIFEAAKQNAPSILFIDDSDVIFESGEELGLYRYLLTMLDGLESESNSRICVILTAMDVSSLPPALVRSGRIELWLEMVLPDESARSAILARQSAGLPPDLRGVDLPQVVAVTQDFTGADLKRLVEDARTLYAYDRARGEPLRDATGYFVTAVEQVRTNKEHYARADSAARAQRPRRPGYFGPFGGTC